MEAILDKVARLVATRDFLLYQRNLEMRSEYVSKLGQYELAAVKLSTDAEKMRRKLDLAEQTLKQGGTLDESAIDEQLAQEFLDKDQLIEEMTANLFMAMSFQSMPRMSREDQSQMLYLYQRLAKAYYPDFCPEDESRGKQWEEIRDLYQQWDLEGLTEKDAIAEQQNCIENTEKTADPEQLKQLQKTLQQEVDAILQQFPFNLKEILEDEEQLNKHREDIQENAAKADRELQALQKKVTLLFEPVSQVLS